jgi:hypothetical protein
VTLPTGVAGVSAAFVNGGTFRRFRFHWRHARALLEKGTLSFVGYVRRQPLILYLWLRPPRRAEGPRRKRPTLVARNTDAAVMSTANLFNGRKRVFSAFHVHLIPDIQSPFAALAETSSSSQPICGVELGRSKRSEIAGSFRTVYCRPRGRRPSTKQGKQAKYTDFGRFSMGHFRSN